MPPDHHGLQAGPEDLPYLHHMAGINAPAWFHYTNPGVHVQGYLPAVQMQYPAYGLGLQFNTFTQGNPAAASPYYAHQDSGTAPAMAGPCISAYVSQCIDQAIMRDSLAKQARANEAHSIDPRLLNESFQAIYWSVERGSGTGFG
ncbi:hypothetical protein K470DRAFT_265773 [Piedraia hortae CBS 480.64]|uniref:Uncharacterized protein n=1 Tax=Piedraia hortae CBS 480.64 TaxID=1314780 RepID=A0A6A7BVW0_9PEZI|nr:hypothetical protein K470DRAFT_265773 [Piedraia hortae CBS 480.64]